MVGGDETVERIVESTDGFGADYTFEATGNVAVMRQAVEAARMAWGLGSDAGVAGDGEALGLARRRPRQGGAPRQRPALPDHRPPRRRLLLRRRQGPRPGSAAGRARHGRR